MEEDKKEENNQSLSESRDRLAQRIEKIESNDNSMVQSEIREFFGVQNERNRSALDLRQANDHKMLRVPQNDEQGEFVASEMNILVDI